MSSITKPPLTKVILPEFQLLKAQVHKVHICFPYKWNHLLCLAYFAQHYAYKTLKPSLGTPTFLSVLIVYWWLSSFLHISSPETCNSVKQTLYSDKYLLSIQTMPGIMSGDEPWSVLPNWDFCFHEASWLQSVGGWVQWKIHTGMWLQILKGMYYLP